ncbi:hypothetical protein TcasGA2_TC005730 [Tribolium castaneum]|uniref:Protein sleepless n=1 Tax=Tribolium castaneum TaxID=7070 RepID=D6WWK2_TRICA|nr:PREDICTED: uncharacterized protein LOC663642 [Tribolium castaneum]EFA08126.1 hypothetical protein TcasGA2_TC005730 [Tribolium castaneum]|eukprot:XP_976460.1 PREDICTED: uncharacterized protein LOC663642 [Tribolium castaneum]
MKVCSAVLLVAVFAILYPQSTEANVSKCYYCMHTCSDPLEVQECPSYGDWRCISAKLKDDRVKGCISSSDSATKQNCDTIDNADDGKCFICDSDLCNSAGVYSASVVLLSSLFFLLTKLI